ncbi:MAG: right-handed parallel beta-helix repeat-containing protein [Deltaproteobacteria bacterium]|nr:right-handed parallel beta-helix repeat-containing protein [Deltaproteobacteria bacterium]
MRHDPSAALRLRAPVVTCLVAAFLGSIAAACGGGGATGGDQTWTAAESPYRFEQDVTIAAGTTLTIEPGVTVELAEGVSIIIEGQLIARGIEASPIRFTGMETGSGPARWGSLVLGPDSAPARYQSLHEYLDGSILEWCVLDHARRALRLTGASPYVNRCRFELNETDPGPIEGGAAMLIEKGAAPRVTGCTFQDNLAAPVGYGGAIYVDDADPIIQGNTFQRNRATYGGALATNLMAAPIVGNVFEDNETDTEGGAIALVSTAAALLGNRVAGNHARTDGAGIHVCTDCNPHAVPTLLDNTVTDNVSDNANPALGAAGIGAAFIRTVADNNIHGNLRAGLPSDFGWFNDLSLGYPEWLANPTLGANWWGATDAAAIAATIFDGRDDARFGLVTLAPPLTEAVAAPRPRAVLATRQLGFVDPGTTMLLFLSVSNPGPARDLELLLMLEHGAGVLLYQGPIDLPGATSGRGLHSLALPADGVFFTTLLAPEYPGAADLPGGVWRAVLFDADTGELLSLTDVRFDYGDGTGGGPGEMVTVGVTVAGATVMVLDTEEQLTAALGAPPRRRDVGPFTWFEYPEHDLAGFLTGATGGVVSSLHAGPAFTGTTTDGVAIGAAADSLGALGTAGVEPFLGTAWYPDRGTALELKDGAVDRIHLF